MPLLPASPLPARLRRLARAFAYGAICALVITAIVFLIRQKSGPVISLDNRLVGAATDFTRPRPGFRHFLLQWQHAFLPGWVYLVATAICLWMWLVKKYRTRAWWAFGTMMIGWFLALQIKLLVERARPVVSDPVSHSPGYSFPSGHAANATLAACVITLLVWPVARSVVAKVVVLTLAVVVSLGTALDRVFLGVHFPTDVLGGIVFGVGFALASYAGYLGWQPPKEQR